MKVKNVAMLVRKDLRMSRWVFAAAVIIWMMPLLLSTIHWAATEWFMRAPYSIIMVDNLSIVGGVLLLLTIPLVAWQVMAREETDRSVAFLAYVPFTRREAAVGKAISSLLLSGTLLALCICIYAFSSAVAAWYHQSIDWQPTVTGIIWSFAAEWGRSMAEYAKWVVPGIAVAFGATWLAGAVVRSAALATFVGIVTPVLLWTLIFSYDYEQNRRPELDWRAIVEQSWWHYQLWLGAAGVLFFAIGMAVFLRRKSAE